MIQLKFRQFQTDSEDDSAMIQKGIFHEGCNKSITGVITGVNNIIRGYQRHSVCSLNVFLVSQ